jgi:hypothetical protein
LGIVSRFERRLQGAVGDGLARVFGGGVVPKEVESALQREAADQCRPAGGGVMLVPNSYVISINPSDYNELASDHDLAVRAFSKHLEDYIAEQGWQTYGEVRVAFEPSPTLHIGQFRTRGTVDPDVGRHPPDPMRRHPTDRPPANPLTGAGPMTQNSGYDPRREPADSDNRGRSEYPADPRTGARGFATPLSASRGGYQNGGGYGGQPERGYGAGSGYANGYEQPADEYQNGYGNDRGYGGGYGEERAGNDRGYGAGASGGYGEERGGNDRGYGAAGGYGGGADRGYGEQSGGGYGGGYGAGGGYGEERGGNDRGYGAGGGYGEERGGNDRGYAAGYGEQSGYGYGEQSGGYGDAPQAYDKSTAYPQADRGYGGPSGYGQQPPAYDQRQGGYPGADAGYGQQAQGGRPGGAGNYGGPGHGGGYTASLQLDDGSGRTYQLREGSNIIGRGQDAHFRLPDTGVSRRHIEVRWDGQVAMLSDLGSTNGTLVNGSPVQDWQLADGDVIRAGHSEILIRIL